MTSGKFPSDKQIDFATVIAETVGADLPEEFTADAYSDFISENQDEFYGIKKEVRAEQYKGKDFFYLNHSYGYGNGYNGDSVLNRNPKS